MYSSTFIFAKKQYDSEFYRLDEAIAEAAKEIPGYLGEEAWENASTGLISNVYYWESLEALQALISVISLATVNTAALYIVGSVRNWPGFPGFAIFTRVVMGSGLAAMAGMGIGPEAFWGAATWEWLGALIISIAWRYETGRGLA